MRLTEGRNVEQLSERASHAMPLSDFFGDSGLRGPDRREYGAASLDRPGLALLGIRSLLAYAPRGAHCYDSVNMADALVNNPLLSISHPIAFERISAEHVEPAIDHLLEQCRQRVARLEQPDLPRTYEATLAALEEATLPLEL